MRPVADLHPSIVVRQFDPPREQTLKSRSNVPDMNCTHSCTVFMQLLPVAILTGYFLRMRVSTVIKTDSSAGRDGHGGYRHRGHVT
jgi:hypothetical protein